ncbi:hypothetical protein EIN_057770 [Entamoeba invadens IP1]|uniref:hypothetical protein n=1 Tax=Entamoeba invadens IP1 TaxID=370355 RepID=UPI0002C3DED8|nr:hypothetical protein EIN_057770 [Entamoeba invadens IP1]ELP93372.1 hypothetical protein EIN_057770 [Entamoeba invadens IP1]|eukprot:XP_004260143.1 hypothetical protein EIN_057770 [Entamoeba invadens IP1]
MKFFRSLFHTTIPVSHEEPITSFHNGRTTTSFSHAVHTETYAPLCVLSFPSSNPKLINENALKMIKTVHHKNILKTLDVISKDKSIFVLFEESVPLSLFVKTYLLDTNEIMLGLYTISSALDFLHQNGYKHLSFSMESVFVTKSGEWKLGDLQFVFKEAPSNLANNFVQRDEKKMFWQFANCFKNAPKEIVEILKENRIDTIEEILFNSNIQAIPIITVYKTIHNYTLLDENARKTFLKYLAGQRLKDNFLCYTVLPFYIKIFESELIEARFVVEPILRLSNGLTEFEFEREIEPVIVKLIESTLQIRYNTLCNLRSCIEQMNTKFVEKIVPTIMVMCEDSNESIRDASLRGLCAVLEKTKGETKNLIYERFLKGIHDSSIHVRTNAVICVDKSLGKFEDLRTRELVIMAAKQATKDFSLEMRLSVMSSLNKIMKLFTGEELALKVLPLIPTFLIDKRTDVRSKARSVFGYASAELLKYSETLDDLQNLTMPDLKQKETEVVRAENVPVQRVHNSEKSEAFLKERCDKKIERAKTEELFRGLVVSKGAATLPANVDRAKRESTESLEASFEDNKSTSEKQNAWGTNEANEGYWGEWSKAVETTKTNNNMSYDVVI